MLSCRSSVVWALLLHYTYLLTCSTSKNHSYSDQINKEPTVMVNILSPKMLCKQCVKKFLAWAVGLLCWKSHMFLLIWQVFRSCYQNVLHTGVILWSQKNVGPVILVSLIAHHRPNVSWNGTSRINAGNLLWDCTFPLWWNQTSPLNGIILNWVTLWLL